MDDLRQKAEGGVDATRMQDAEDTSHVVVAPALHHAATIGESADSYPRFGDWFETEDGWLECPRDLAREVLNAAQVENVGFPMRVEITEAELVDDEWRVETTISEAE